MKVTIDAKTSKLAVQQLFKLVGSKYITIKANKELNRVELSMEESGRAMCVYVKAEVQEEGAVSTSSESFSRTLTKRDKIQLVHDDDKGQLDFKDVGKKDYKGHLTVVPAILVSVATPSEEDGNSDEELYLHPEELKEILKGANLVALNPIYGSGKADKLPVIFHLNSNGLEVCTGDNYHVAYYRKKTDSFEKTMTVTVPRSTVATLTQLAEGNEAFKLTFSESALFASCKDWVLVTPQGQTESGDITVESVRELFKSAAQDEDMTEATTKVTVSKSEMDRMMENLTAVREEGKHIKIVIGNSKLQMDFLTNLGQIESETSADIQGTDGTYEADLSTMLEVLGKAQDTEVLSLNFVKESFVWFVQKHETGFLRTMAVLV